MGDITSLGFPDLGAIRTPTLVPATLDRLPQSGSRPAEVASSYETRPDFSSLTPVLAQDAQTQGSPSVRVVPGVNGVVPQGTGGGSRVDSLPWVVAVERGEQFRGPPNLARAAYGSRNAEVGNLQTGLQKAGVFNDARYSLRIDDMYGNQTANGTRRIGAELSKALGEPVAAAQTGIADKNFVQALKKYEAGVASGRVARNATVDAFIDGCSGQARSAVPTPAPRPAVVPAPTPSVVPPASVTRPPSNVIALPPREDRRPPTGPITPPSVSGVRPARSPEVQAGLAEIRNATLASPTIQGALDYLDKSNLKVEFTTSGGTYYTDGRIVIDTHDSDKPSLGMLVAHEVSHAQGQGRIPSPTSVSREVYQEAVLADEITAECVAAKAYIELGLSGTKASNPGISLDAYLTGTETEVQRILESGVQMSPEDLYRRVDAAGRAEVERRHRTGEIVTGTDQKPYMVVAGEFWDRIKALAAA